MRAELTFGITPGYGKTDGETSIGFVCETLMRLASVVKEEVSEYPSFVLVDGLCGYPRDFGCPEHGERCFVAIGTWISEFAAKDVWMAAWKEFAECVKFYFKQSTVRLEFIESVTFYYKDEKDYAGHEQ